MASDFVWNDVVRVAKVFENFCKILRRILSQRTKMTGSQLQKMTN